MSKQRVAGGLIAATLALAGLALTAAPANAETATITVTPVSGLLDTSETRATGHNDFLADGLHVWTEGGGSTDKAAGYIAVSEPLAGIGEPTLDWTLTDPGLPAVPGKQLVVDFDHDGTPDGILVGEPVYGNEWWLSSSAATWVKDGAPHDGGGYGSQWYGTLEEWATAFDGSQIGAVGYSMGSGMHGDGVISSMTYGATTYRFALGVGPCLATVDDGSQVYALTQDCSTYETIHVADGWTLDGAGYTIHAVEDAGHPNFPGPVVVSATGDDEAPASMGVQNLTIDSQGFGGGSSGGTLSGIRFNRAGGNVSNVTISGISHGNGVQEGIGLWVRNRDAGGSTAVPAAQVTVDQVTVDRYQKGGIVLDGNLQFQLTHSTIGSSAAADGTPLTTLAANAVQISRTAHGTATDNHVALNEYDPVPPPGDGSDATAVLLYDAADVTLARNVIAGADGDVGIDVYNDTSGAVHTVLSASCNLLTRDETSGDYDPYGVGLATYDDGSTPVDVTLSDSTFSGWNHDSSTISYDGSGDPVYGPGPVNQQVGDCPPSAPTAVMAPGGDQQSDVSWSASTAPEYAPLSGYTASAIDSEGNVVASQDASAGITIAHLTGLTSGQDYTISVIAHGTGGDSAAGTAVLHATSVALTSARPTVVYGKHTSLSGHLTSTDGSAVLGGRSVALQRRAAGSSDTWVTFATVSTNGSGAFGQQVSPSVNTEYRALYAGDPDLSSISPVTTVNVAEKVHLYATRKHLPVGKKLVVSGRVLPGPAGGDVQLQMRQTGGGWLTVKTSTTASDKTFALRYKITQTGNPAFRVTADGDATHVSGTSKSFVVTVH